MSISAAFLCAGFSYSQGITTWFYYALFAFFATFSVYNGQRLLKSLKTKETPWLVWVKRFEKQLYLVVTGTSLITLIILFAVLNCESISWAIILFAGLISLFYVLRVAGINLRELPYIKIHLIALTWVSILLAFPLINEEIYADILPSIGAHYLYVIAVTIPFDIRDLKHDAPSQKTIPQLLGVRTSKLLSILLLVAFCAVMMSFSEALRFNLLFYLAIIVVAVLIIMMHENRSDVYCAALIDGSISLLGLSYFF